MERKEGKVNPVEKDTAYLEAGIPELETYLLSNELYWPITTRGYVLPRLTIGGILLAKSRLEARSEGIGTFVEHIDLVHTKWRVAWEAKADREVQARFRLWSNYLADYRQNPERHVDAFPQEVSNRVMLHLLIAGLPKPQVEEELFQLDSVLRTNFISGDFIWDVDLRSGFPPEEYWFLYGNLRS